MTRLGQIVRREKRFDKIAAFSPKGATAFKKTFLTLLRINVPKRTTERFGTRFAAFLSTQRYGDETDE